MNKRNPPAWTKQWLKELPWRELQDMNSSVIRLGIPTYGIVRRRCLQIQAEWARRKKEHGSGFIAKLEREGFWGGAE